MTRRPARLATILIATACVCCAGRRVMDDATFARLEARFVRDSIVIDSLERLVTMDSLFRLYRTVVTTRRAPVPLVSAVSCEFTRQSFLHGKIPALRRLRRMLDTIYADQGITGMERAGSYFFSFAPRSGYISTSDCGKLPPPFPDSVSGVATYIEPKRPKR